MCVLNDVSCFKGNIRMMSCPQFGGACYKGVVNKILRVKVLCHIPIIPRLQRMFRTLEMLELMLWHSQNGSQDGLVRHPCDSKGWKHIEHKFFEFAVDPQNLHLGLFVDGVNPFKLTRSMWSTWPVMLLNYNLPP